jgi:tetratricopeptide (TPR) repeat protein
VLGSARTLFGDIDEASARGDLIEIHIDSAEERWDRVLPALERLLKQYPEIRCLPQLQDVYEDVQTRRGMCLANIGRFSEALPLLEEATSFTTQPPPNDIYRELGRCYISIGDYDRASEMLTKAISGGLEEAGLAAAHYDLGTLLMRKKAYARALQNLELAEKYSQSTNASATWKQGLYKAIAICFHELGMDREATEYYKLIINS